jgi:hypothetical protein
MNAYVHRQGRSQHIGEVTESDEAVARCAALSTYGVGDDENRCRRGPLA